MLRSLLALLSLCIWLALPALGTTSGTVEVKCPVCATSSKASVVYSSNTFCGTDPDFLAHSSGGSPFMIVIHTCPTCHYTNFAKEFPAAVKADLNGWIQAGGLKLPSGAPNKGPFPAWVRYDLYGQILEFTKAPAERRARIALSAAWAVRKGDRTFAVAGDAETLVAAVAGVKNSEDHAAWAVTSARAALSRLSGLTDEEAVKVAPAIGAVLRERGETPALLNALPALKQHISTDIEPLLRESIEREAAYQRRTIALLEEALKTDTKLAASPTAATLIYVIGELHRRLGDPAAARTRFAEAMARESKPPWLAELCASQKEAVDLDFAP